MLANQNPQTRGVLQHPPGPSLPCPYCPVCFRNNGGRTQHIRAKHSSNGPEPQESLSHDLRLQKPPSFQGGFGDDANIDIEHLDSDRDEDRAPSSPRGFSVDVDIDIDYLDSDRDEDQVPSSPRESDADVNIDIEYLDSDRDEDQAPSSPRIDYFDSDRDEDQVPSSPRESDVDVNVDIELLDSDRDEDQAPSSPQGFGVDVNIDIELLDSDRDETPPGPYIHSRQGSNGSLSPGDGARDRRVPDPPPVTRTYHPKLNGKSSLPLVLHIFIKRLL
jgi:hypothetical protein